MVTLDEDQYFNLQANVTSPGYQTLALKGYLVKYRNGETYVAPLLPMMFFGADGNQLGASWRQYIPVAGQQTILSRSGGQPKVGEPDIYWRKIASKEVPKEQIKLSVLDQVVEWWSELNPLQKAALSISVVSSIVGLSYYLTRRW